MSRITIMSFLRVESFPDETAHHTYLKGNSQNAQIRFLLFVQELGTKLQGSDPHAFARLSRPECRQRPWVQYHFTRAYNELLFNKLQVLSRRATVYFV